MEHQRLTEVESRRTAHRVAKYCRDRLNLSAHEFKATLEEGMFLRGRLKEAMDQLAERGELEHLVRWVWGGGTYGLRH